MVAVEINNPQHYRSGAGKILLLKKDKRGKWNLKASLETWIS
jgi:hypothetical protein